MEELLVSLTHKPAAGFNSEYQSFSMAGFLFIYLFLLVKLSPAFHLCSAFFCNAPGTQSHTPNTMPGFHGHCYSAQYIHRCSYR